MLLLCIADIIGIYKDFLNKKGQRNKDFEALYYVWQVVYWGIWVIFILWVDISLNGVVKWRILNIFVKQPFLNIFLQQPKTSVPKIVYQNRIPKLVF